MRKSGIVILTAALIIFSFSGLNAQYRGFTDDFNDGTLDFVWRNRPPVKIWETRTPATYKLSVADDAMHIEYKKIAGTGAYDKFTFDPFRSINVRFNPRIQLEIRSDIDIKLTVSPMYSDEPSTSEYIEKEVQGDKQWHTMTFELTPEYYTDYGEVEGIDFYFDRDTAMAREGNISIDNFRVGWYVIKAMDVEAQVDKGRVIALKWNTTDAERAGKYQIHRAAHHNFEVGDNTLLTEVEGTSYRDSDVVPYRHYYYRIVPVHQNGEVYFASEEVHGETFVPGELPVVKVAGTNTSTVKKYEKFEALLDLDNVGIGNPFDPEDIDVYAVFTAPSGKKIKINGFFDDFQDADKWKVRFSPGETGTYTYQVFVNDASGIGKSPVAKFTAVDSKHHGWIRPSKVNPHYFVHDDGTTYYGVGVYSPWRNDEERFNTFAEHDANLFAIWDITYGGFVNGTGLIEEELGRYNQLKLGRIDSMLTILEENDIQLMYAIWPHDLFSETVWAAVWDRNPYNQLTDVKEVYSDSLVWEYQKKKYRYMIARFAHSRSWGIWELINEMNGTDGWQYGDQQACFDWVERCEKYFQENDPYNHPVTASFSGGFSEYREALYERIDIPNIHIYPAQGWELKYPADSMRSAMRNYAWASRRFWDNFEKPAIFGEAGAGLAYFDTRDTRYHISYHNQIWAALTNGLAATPVWWDYPVMTEEDWDQLKILAGFVADIDFANLPYQPLEVSAEETDLYVMGTNQEAFGWGRTFIDGDISNTDFTLTGLADGTYEVTWIDPWTGKSVKSASSKASKGTLEIGVPDMTPRRADIAFKIAVFNVGK